MNKRFSFITRIETRWLDLSFMALVIAGNWIDGWLYFPLLIAMAAIVGLIRYLHDRKWLKEATEYLRIQQNRSIGKIAVAVLVITGGVLALQYYDLLEDLNLKRHTTSTLLAIQCILLLSNQLNIFVDSIKTFEDGLQLPGRKGKLLPWRDIHSMKLDDALQISSKDDYTFDIDERDISRTRKVIDFWQERSGHFCFD